MRILIACEESGTVRDALEDMGHDAWSCDFQSTSSEQTRRSGKHLQCDVLTVLDMGWDMLIGFPYCTYSTNSGVCWLYKKEGRWRQMHIGVKFFNALWNAPIKKIVLENPVPHEYAMNRMTKPYDQIIQPWMFGHMEEKKTCLWLKNLPPLMTTDNVYDAMMELPKNVRQRIHYTPPGPERSRIHSKTFQGVADAMATQWG